MRKKGFYFSLDALLAAVLLVTGLLLITRVPAYEQDTQHIDYISKDVLNALSTLKVNELDLTPYSSQWESGVPEPNNTILEQIGEYWAENYTKDARLLAEIVLNGTIPKGVGFSLGFSNTTFFVSNSSTPDPRQVVASRRMISGIAQDKPLTGSSSSAYLRKITNKKTSSYIYFGGFVGQGNLSFFTVDLPSDVDNNSIEDMTFEVDAIRDFSLSVNGEFCMPIFTPLNPLGEMDSWNITPCRDSILQGQKNWFNFTFSVAPGDINESFFAGGYIKITYRTDEFQKNVTPGLDKYQMPGISGVANLYDSFYIPGTLNNLSVHLVYNSENTAYLTIGNREVWYGNSSGVVATVDLNDSWFQSGEVALDYAFISNRTVPIRFASFNNSETNITGGDADIVIITDSSGSMKKSVANIMSNGNNVPHCNPDIFTADIYTDDSARRQDLAICLDKLASAILLNGTGSLPNGNRLFFVEMNSDVINTYESESPPFVTYDRAEEIIDGFKQQAKGQTCLGCTLNAAYNLFDTYSSPERKKFIILMSDGLPTHCAKGNPVCQSTSQLYAEDEDCAGFCDISGSCHLAPNTVEGCTDNACDDAVGQTNFSARRVVDDFGAIIYAVAFGEVDMCTESNALLNYIAQYSNGTYQSSSTGIGLKLVYENISNTILSQIDMKSQTVTLKGDLKPSMLSPESYIAFNYTPNDAPFSSNLISISFQTDKFDNCTDTFNITNGIMPYDAVLLSYSGIHWTDRVWSNANMVFNLSEFILPYQRLGDPFRVHIPSDTLHSGVNTIEFGTGDSPLNYTNCSLNNSITYLGLFNSSTSRSTVLERADGCNWTVEFEDGTTSSFVIPSSPVPTRTCNYTSASYPPGNYDSHDAYDFAVFNILNKLDFDKDGKVLVNLNKEDLTIIVVLVNRVPYLWGPSFAEARTWQ
ncbi:MAG: vWA domain-containing protein [Candidatus Woesearchaeota archaeon]